jgi:hypothetical protein
MLSLLDLDLEQYQTILIKLGRSRYETVTIHKDIGDVTAEFFAGRWRHCSKRFAKFQSVAWRCGLSTEYRRAKGIRHSAGGFCLSSDRVSEESRLL